MNVKLDCSVMIFGTGIRKGDVEAADRYFEEEFKIDSLRELERLVEDFKEDCIDSVESEDEKNSRTSSLYRSGEFEYQAVVDIEIEGA